MRAPRSPVPKSAFLLRLVDADKVAALAGCYMPEATMQHNDAE